ncbi:hypothetical protein V2J09_007907 [Rumex salicifolius]
MLPACFSSQSSSSRTQQNPQNNLITCTYQTQIYNTPILLTLTWSKTQFSHTLTLHAPPLFSITVSLSPSSFAFFRARPGSKSISLPDARARAKKVKLYWDFTRAVYTRVNSAEPDSCYYLAVACNGRVEFFLGDIRPELTRRVGTSRESESLVSRREHVFGRRSYVTRARFSGAVHEIEIECSGGTMKVKIDGKIGLVVKRLGWKFRGNERISVAGLEVDFFWDVFNWVNGGEGSGRIGGGGGHGVFVFQVGEGGVWPEMVGPEKKLMRKSLSASPSPAAMGGAGISVSPAPSWSSSVWQWAEESSDCGRSSCSNSSARSCYGGGSGGGGGFSLVLYAWRRDS